MSALERGFKSWAERLSAGIRRELELTPYAPLPPQRLAGYLDVALLTPHEVPGLSTQALHQLLEHDPWGWSAVTHIVGPHTTVIYNPRHSSGRQASNIAHELAHVLLDHDPSTLIMSPDGSVVMRTFDARQEDEASWLSGCLLLPRVALLRAIRSGKSAEGIAEEYGATPILVNYRSRITGVTAQTRRFGSQRDVGR